MQITPHFNLEEFHCKDGSLYPKKWIKQCLKPLCQQLEIIRKHFDNRPVTITSGYRTSSYNRKVGGVRRSQHLLGKAVDIKVKGIPARRVAKGIRELIQNGKLAINGLGSYASFTHIDIRQTSRLIYWIKK